MEIILWIVGTFLVFSVIGGLCNNGIPLKPQYEASEAAKSFLHAFSLLGMLRAIQALNMEIYPNPFPTEREQKQAIENVASFLKTLQQQR